MKDQCLFLKYSFYMLDIVTLPHFFHLKNMLPDNLSKICVYILTLLLAFPISVLLRSSIFTSGRISSDFIWEERKLKNFKSKQSVWHHFLVCFSEQPLLEAFFCPNIFQHVESSCWMMCFSTLPFDGSRHDRIILVGRFF